MQPGRAPIIVVEGIDGSGKGTQSVRLLQRLQDAGHHSELLSFPRYQETFFGQRIGEFLNGRFGKLSELHPFLISLLFAGDRFESRGLIKTATETNDFVVFDRYVSSSLAHQVAKTSPEERAELRDWICEVEYQIYGLPRPDLVILLDLPAPMAQELIHRKQPRSYTEKAADLQESDGQYLGQVRDVYLELAKSTPEWRIVSVNAGDEFRPIEQIEQEIWEHVEKTFLKSSKVGN